MRLFSSLLLLLTLSTCVRAQTIAFTEAFPPVTHNDAPLDLAWFGGLNAPLVQQADLDGDGRDDLYIFDKAGQQHLALRGTGGADYEEAPALTAFFPDSIEQWTILQDFDFDGTPDLFAYAPIVNGVSVYRGYRREDGLLAFTLIDFGDPLPQLYTPLGSGRSPLFVSSIDYPAVADVDFDGDLDILTFAVAGGYLEWYRNMSVERGFGTDTLIYELVDQCWGGFFESGLSTALDLAPAPGDCFDNLTGPGAPGRPRHSGSTILAFDYDGNGLTDVLLGDISFRFLVLGLNNGTNERAWISEQDTTWNTDGVIATIPSFPAAFHIDVDNDGDGDLIGSPSVVLNGQDHDVTWWYRNDGTDAAPDFNFVQRDFLVDRMLDVGTSSNVTVFDENGDGRPDLLIGNNDEYTGTNLLDSRLRLLRNVTPTGGETAFELVDEDYLGLSAFITTTWAFAPTFGDLDGDGDLDVVLGERGGKLIYGENVAGPANPAAFAPLVFEWLGIDAGQFSKPFLADLDRDGKTDLLVGGFDGRIRFYRNVGTDTAPAFAPQNDAPGNVLQLGGINTNSPGVSTGHPTPWVLQNPDYTLVLAGNRAGFVEAYRFGSDSSYTDDYTLVTKAAGDLDVGTFANPAFADFNGDGKLAAVVGNRRGGVRFFNTNLTADGTTSLFAPTVNRLDFEVFPNPAGTQITISGLPREATEMSLLDVTGRVLRTERIGAGTQVRWTLKERSAGVYLIRVSGAGGVGVKRVMVR